MADTITFAQSVTGGGRSISGSVSTSVESLSYLEVTVTGSSANVLHLFPIDVSSLQAVAVGANHAVTVNCNDDSGGSPDHTFSVVANRPSTWVTGEASGGNPFGGSAVDVSDVRVTTDTANDTLFKLLVGCDPTP